MPQRARPSLWRLAVLLLALPLLPLVFVAALLYEIVSALRSTEPEQTTTPGSERRPRRRGAGRSRAPGRASEICASQMSESPRPSVNVRWPIDRLALDGAMAAWTNAATGRGARPLPAHVPDG
jgi:hypothetical protein